MKRFLNIDNVINSYQSSKPTLKPSPVRNFRPSYKPISPVPFLLPAVTGEAMEVLELVLEGILFL